MPAVLNSVDGLSAVKNRGVRRVVSERIKNVGQGSYAAEFAHAEKEILIFAGHKLFSIAADRIECVAAKHCRTVSERNVARITNDPPAIARANYFSIGVDAVAQSSHCDDVRMTFQNLQLAPQAIRM